MIFLYNVNRSVTVYYFDNELIPVINRHFCRDWSMQPRRGILPWHILTYQTHTFFITMSYLWVANGKVGGRKIKQNSGHQVYTRGDPDPPHKYLLVGDWIQTWTQTQTTRPLRDYPGMGRCAPTCLWGVLIDSVGDCSQRHPGSKLKGSQVGVDDPFTQMISRS